MKVEDSYRKGVPKFVWSPRLTTWIGGELVVGRDAPARVIEKLRMYDPVTDEDCAQKRRAKSAAKARRRYEQIPTR